MEEKHVNLCISLNSLLCQIGDPDSQNLFRLNNDSHLMPSLDLTLHVSLFTFYSLLVSIVNP